MHSLTKELCCPLDSPTIIQYLIKHFGEGGSHSSYLAVLLNFSWYLLFFPFNCDGFSWSWGKGVLHVAAEAKMTSIVLETVSLNLLACGSLLEASSSLVIYN